MLISVHLPKTAGTSFGLALQQHFGDSMLWDNSDRPLTKSPFLRKLFALSASLKGSGREANYSPYQCIHGHFLPCKFHKLKSSDAVKFITWLRDPVDRVASHYYYWTREAPPEDASAMRRQVYHEQWSLTRFCLGEEFRNIYSEFLWGFGLEPFDFVGITEYYASELEYFSDNLLNSTLKVCHENANPGRQGPRYIEDSALRSEIEAWHASDVEYYRKALRLRQSRLEREGALPQ